MCIRDRVTVVDGLEHERNRPLAPAVDAQVEHADVIAVSKLDLLGEGQAERVPELVATLRTLNPASAILAEQNAGASALALARLLADPELGAGRAAPTSAAPHAHREEDR